jgi:hypothetical protein
MVRIAQNFRVHLQDYFVALPFVVVPLADGSKSTTSDGVQTLMPSLAM